MTTNDPDDPPSPAAQTPPTGDAGPAAYGLRGPAAYGLLVLYAEDPKLLGERFFLEHNPTRVGRGAGNHIRLDSSSVSRWHAHIVHTAQGWLLIDDGSTNSTFHNDEPITVMPLRSGDRITIGRTIFKFLPREDLERRIDEGWYQPTVIDGLTKIHNKRYLFEALKQEIPRAQRDGLDLSMVMLDVDHFKRINDTFGHLAGDYVLAELARVIKPLLPAGATFVRYGGEELCVVLPETRSDVASSLAETLRKAVEQREFVFETHSIMVTVSAGVASLKVEDQAHDLIKRVDISLYMAKREGRNRVHCHGLDGD